jgi:hypothetical protein
MKRILTSTSRVLYLLSLILTACTSSQTTSVETTSSVPTRNSTSSPGITAISTLLPAETASVIKTPTQLIIQPRIEEYCPDQKEILLSELGLASTSVLILRDDKTNSLWFVSGDNLIPQEIPNLNPEKVIPHYIEMSPSKQWFPYLVYTETKENIAYYDLWISSVDGQRQWFVLPNVNSATRARWVGDNEIEIWQSVSIGECPEHLLSINPFTLMSYVPTKIPQSPQPLCHFYPITNPDRTQVIYLEDRSWSLYNLENGETMTIFPWLIEDDTYSSPPNKFIGWTDEGITLIFPRKESLDFMLDLPVELVDATNLSLTKIKLSPYLGIYHEYWNWLSLTNKLIGLDLYMEEPKYGIEEADITQFVILDIQNLILRRYCLDRADLTYGRGEPSSFIHASADERFLAWTIFEPPGLGRPLEIVILDTITGHIARLGEGYELLDWGEFPEAVSP